MLREENATLSDNARVSEDISTFGDVLFLHFRDSPLIHCWTRGYADGAGDGDALCAVRRAGDVPLRDGQDEPRLAAGGGRRHEAAAGPADGHTAAGRPHRAGRDGSAPKQLGSDGDGHRLRQRRAAGTAPGGGRHLRHQHRHHHDGTAHRLRCPDAGVPGAVFWASSSTSRPAGPAGRPWRGGVLLWAALRGHRHFGPGFAAAGRAGGLSRLDDPGEGSRRFWASCWASP